MDSLDLLKSLTKGVNNKINQEQESSVEYIVSTSLRNKNKKSTPPIIKEVSKPIDTSLQDSIFEEEVIEDIIDDTVFDFVDSTQNEEIESEEVLEEPMIEDTFVEDIIDDNIIDDNIIDDIGMQTINISEAENDGHILEELPIVKKEVHKIQRNGNPFKRGPRKKKNTVITPIEDSSLNDKEAVITNIEVSDQPIIQEVEEEVVVQDLDVQIEEHKVEVMSAKKPFEEELEVVNESDEIDFSEEITAIGDIDFANIFGDISDTDAPIMETTTVDEEEPIINENEEEVVVVEEPKVEENSEEDNLFEEVESINTEIVEEVEIDNSIPIVTPSVDDTEKVSSEDEKFRNCKYYKGMPVEEFLRENSDYRETIFVEHFYKKEELQALLVEGKILIKKGKYRL